MTSFTESQREHILQDLINKVADADNPLDALRDGEFLKSFFDSEFLETGFDSEGNPKEDEDFARAIVDEAFEHFDSLEDIVIGICFADKNFGVLSRRDYIYFYLKLDADRASQYEIEEAEDSGDCMACESVQKAYDATCRWDSDTRIDFLKDIIAGNNQYSAKAFEIYKKLKNS